jgi:hypothetical protein
MVAYVCWWKKPLDVGIPIPLPIGHRLRGAEWNPSGSGFNIDDTYPLRYELLVRERRIAKTVLAVVARAAYDFAWDFGYNAKLWSTAMAAANCLLHATAWNSHFPTEVERGLWRAACVGVALGPFSICVLVWKKELECYVMQYIYRCATKDIGSIPQLIEQIVIMWGIVVRSGEGQDNIRGPETMRPPSGLPATWPVWCRHLLIVGIIVCAALYGTSIMFFLVEAFISLRSIQASAYKTVEWADYLPHF